MGTSLLVRYTREEAHQSTVVSVLRHDLFTNASTCFHHTVYEVVEVVPLIVQSWHKSTAVCLSTENLGLEAILLRKEILLRIRASPSYLPPCSATSTYINLYRPQTSSLLSA
jgi:hypothetical protein